MKISLRPILLGSSLEVAVIDGTLRLNGEAFDFDQLPAGATLPASAIDSEWFVGPVERIDGELHVTLRLPHGPNPSQAVAFPEPIHVTADGPVTLPFDPEPAPEPEVSEEVRDGMVAFGAAAALALTSGSIDFSQMVTAAQKEALAQVAAREVWKAQRSAAVARIAVTTAAGHTFDGDETSQDRMARAAVGLQAADAKNMHAAVIAADGGPVVVPAPETIKWTLADNAELQVPASELLEALSLAGREQERLWGG